MPEALRRRCWIPTLIGIALVAFLGSSPLALYAADAAPPESASGAERAALDRFVRARPLRGARIGVAVIDLESGESILEWASSQSLVPASNQKLLIAATSLARWGPAHRFETLLLTDQPVPDSGIVEGPLWIVGRGDPSLVSESLWRMAQEIRLAGIREIRGGLAIDSSWFDAQRTHPDWAPVSRRAYHAPTGAFAVNYSSFRIDVRPASDAQAPARVTVVPSIAYFRVRAEALTIPGRGRLDLDLSELPDGSGERVQVRGAMRAGQSPRTYWRSVARPDRYAAELLRSVLETQGIRISGGVRTGRVPTDAELLLRFEGESLADIVRDMNKYSNNFIAEQLLKGLAAERTGEPGSWRAGAEIMRDYLEQASLLDAGTVIVDGSGLSPRNRVSPATLTRLIRHAVLQQGSGPEFLASLPIGGSDGTLEDRKYDPARAVRGKTGHLRSVSSLSGVMPTAAGLRAFAILVNGARGGRLDVDAAIDEFVSTLASIEPTRSPETLDPDGLETPAATESETSQPGE